MKNEKIWYELDAFAKTYSSIISEGRTTCFRLSALFTENIDIKILKGYTNLLRMRINSYRIIYHVYKNEIIIIDVIDAGSRGQIYKNK